VITPTPSMPPMTFSAFVATSRRSPTDVLINAVGSSGTGGTPFAGIHLYACSS